MPTKTTTKSAPNTEPSTGAAIQEAHLRASRTCAICGQVNNGVRHRIIGPREGRLCHPCSQVLTHQVTPGPADDDVDGTSRGDLVTSWASAY